MEVWTWWGILPLVENLKKFEKWGRWDWLECLLDEMSEGVGGPKVDNEGGWSWIDLIFCIEEWKGRGIGPLVENFEKVGNCSRWDQSERCWNLSEGVRPLKVKSVWSTHETQCDMMLV